MDGFPHDNMDELADGAEGVSDASLASGHDALPFSVSVTEREALPSASLMDSESSETWGGADIEEAYLKALQALDAVEVPTAEEQTPLDDTEDSTGAELTTADVPVAAIPAATSKPAVEAKTESAAPPVTPAQIIEAALFVGGNPLTAKKLCGLLRGSFDNAFVEQTIDDLNAEYVTQARPYEIRLGEGGYRLLLRPEYERLRNRVYGAGPREVRLSQEVLEVLALVAYRQPITKLDVEAFRQNSGNMLRQLLQRELISLERGDGGRDDVRYSTTPRFLSLFGLGTLDELPRPDDVDVK